MGVARLIRPTCNVITVRDGRGGIFTYLPEHPLVELNYITIKAGKFRGEHFHKEFWEYFLVVSGRGLYEAKGAGNEVVQFFVTGGELLELPPWTPHVIYAIEDLVAVAGLSKRWDDCAEPITLQEVRR